MEGLIMAGQLILGLSILVGVHEAGHMFAAKFFGMRVEKFSIGFPPKVFSFIKGETEYMLGLLPLGGFVKISGMIDESLDTEQLKTDPEPWEFRAKPAWQRLIVMLGGIIVNIITGMLIFGALMFVRGESFYALEDVNKEGIYANELGQELGFQKGDKIIRLNGQEIQWFEDLKNPEIILTVGSKYTVLRDGKEVEITVTEDFISKYTKNKKVAAGDFISPLFTFTIAEVAPNTPAEKAGIKVGDQITKIGTTPIKYYQDYQLAVFNKANETLEVTLSTAGIERVVNITLDKDGKVGFYPQPSLDRRTQHYGFFTSMIKGSGNAFNVVWINIKAFGMMFSGVISPVDSVGGPIEIARKFYGGSFDMIRFWTITGMLSMVLAFMNILPIPALDGGHVVFLMYEIVSGRAPSEKFMEWAQKIGMVILLGLMIFAFGKDIIMLVLDYLK